MPLAIQRVTLANLDAVVPLFDAYRQFYEQPSDLPRARGWLEERLRREDAVILLATDDGRAVGFTQLYPMFSSVRTGRLWILNDLYVAADARRSGAGRALLAAAEDFARDDGAVGITLETTSDNATARALYRAAGWDEAQTQWYYRSFAQNVRDEPVFSYGTLQDESVQRRLFGRTLDGVADALPGYRMDWLEERDPAAISASGVVRHPVVRASNDPADRVPGTVLRLSAAELAKADDYEAGDYRRVRVRLASGADAWLYEEA
ncbi:MAG TPA: GNAT family N-acetyltransferase [Lysobacter sp.]